jgi:UDP-glucose 4-epimerase
VIWLITGGCGFIGTNLVRFVAQSDPDAGVRVFDNLLVGTREDLAEALQGSACGSAGRVHVVVGDVRELDQVRAAAAGADVIVHLAARTGVLPSLEDPLGDCATNVVGTLNVLEAARLEGVRRVVFASSGAPLGEQAPPLHEGLVPAPMSPYGASKLAGEGYCSAYHGAFGMGTVALRFGNVYGPGSARKQSVVARLIRQGLAGEPWQVFGDGEQTRDYLYVDDLVRCIVAAARSDVAGRVLQVATGRETKLNELIDMLRALLGPRGVMPSVVHGPPRAGEVRRSYADISAARALLGWSPRWQLEAGLRETLSWFVSRAGARDG